MMMTKNTLVFAVAVSTGSAQAFPWYEAVNSTLANMTNATVNATNATVNATVNMTANATVNASNYLQNMTNGTNMTGSSYLQNLTNGTTFEAFVANLTNATNFGTLANTTNSTLTPNAANTTNSTLTNTTIDMPALPVKNAVIQCGPHSEQASLSYQGGKLYFETQHGVKQAEGRSWIADAFLQGTFVTVDRAVQKFYLPGADTALPVSPLLTICQEIDELNLNSQPSQPNGSTEANSSAGGAVDLQTGAVKEPHNPHLVKFWIKVTMMESLVGAEF